MSWQPVVGWEGVYEVSDSGDVRAAGGRVIGQWQNDQGYCLVRLSHRATGRRVMARVHGLVAEAFLPNPDELPCVNHMDNKRSNNLATNLEWCTQGQNLAPHDGARPPGTTVERQAVTQCRHARREG